MKKLYSWFSALPFFKKQILVATAVTCVALVLASLMLYSKFVDDYKNNLLQGLRSKQALISETTKSALVFGDKETADSILSSLSAFPATRFALLFDNNDQLFAEYRRDDQKQQINLGDYFKGNHFDDQQLYIYNEISLHDESIGYILISADTKQLSAQKTQYFLIVFGVFLFAVLLSVALHWRMQKFISAPMNKIVELVSYVTRNRRYHKRIGVGRNDELGTLITSVNSMLDTIEEHEKQLHAHSDRLESLVALRTEQLFNRANYDALTQLPNRHLLVDRLKHGIDNAARDNSKMALLFLDLDRFKVVNDTLGHSVGDELLVHVAERLSSVVRKADSVCRWGGDEFIILIEHLHRKEDVVPLAEQIIFSLSEAVELSENQIHISTSIGIAMYPDDGEDATTLLKHADISMYKAKEKGLSQYCFFENEMLDGSIERLSLEHKLRLALDNKSFHLVYQPQICAETGGVCGIEALIRWKDDELGLLNPVQFLPVAEDVGLMHSLSLWVLEEACSQNKSWQDAGGERTRVAVNLPASFIMHPEAISQILDILDRTKLETKYLELEITENTFISNTEHAIKVLEHLRGMGISIAVDDFGTGYSSMSYLRDLPIETLKIDGSFVKQLGDDQINDGIVQSIVTLGKSLGLSLIAECVENKEQANTLRDMGCDMIQGYYYSKPLSAEKTLDFLTEKARKSA